MSEVTEREPSILAIVLNWNQPRSTILCLQSLLEQKYSDLSVLLIDNESTIAGLEAIVDWCKEKRLGLQLVSAGQPAERADRSAAISLIRNDRNLGYAGGMNTGLVRAVEWGYDWVLLLNNDVVLS